VDGKPAKPFRVGTIVDGRLLLQSVNGRRAVLAAGMNAPAEVALELPVLGK
jgi:general secretion pathway protein C